MEEEVVEAIAAEARFISIKPLIFEAVVAPDILNKARELPGFANWVSETAIRAEGVDALCMLEAIWPVFVRCQGITESFAEYCGQRMLELQRSSTPLRVERIREGAVIPARGHPMDTGLDVTVICVVNPNFGPGVVLYGTGLRVAPPDGYYLEVVARSSTCKQGWGMANALGIIDMQYRGELCIPLMRLTADAPDLPLPARVCQLIVRPLHLCDVEEVQALARGVSRQEGGFGSTGK